MRASPLGRFEAALIVVLLAACSLDRRELLRASDVETGGAGGENGGTDAGGTAGSGAAATGGNGVRGGTGGEAGDEGGGTAGASGGATGGSDSGTGGSDGATGGSGGTTGGSNGTGGDSGATSGGGTGGATTGGAGGLSGSAGQGGATAGGGSGGGVSGSGTITPELEWAEWPMPNPDPVNDYVHDYNVEENDTINDGVTGKVWQRTVPSERFTWAQAKQHCPSGWRLPTAIELISLIDYTRYDPAIDTVAFPSTPAEYFWSSTGTPTSADYGVCVHFADGVVAINAQEFQARVRCVKVPP